METMMKKTGDVSRPNGCLTGAALLVGLLSSGCAWHEPTRVEDDFGQSVRQMVQEQIYDKQAAAEPAVNGPDLLDGTTADIAVDGYRRGARGARTFREQGESNPVPVTGRGDGDDVD